MIHITIRHAASPRDACCTIRANATSGAAEQTADAVAQAKADADKAAADARTAAAAAAKAEREEKEASSPAAVAQREAERRKAVAEADKAAADADRARLTALIPDFGKIERGTLDLSNAEQPLYASALANRALDAAATNVANEVVGAVGFAQTSSEAPATTILLTSDEDLAASDAVYREVTTTLDRLEQAATPLLGPAGGKAIPLALGAALASAIPGIVSLLKTNRTIATTAAKSEDIAAAAATAAALKAHPSTVFSVVHDQFRLLPDGGVQEKVEQLGKTRQNLVNRKLELEAKPEEERDTKRIAMIDPLLTAIDAYFAALTVVPDGSTYSPLALATMREQLHTGSGSAISHVLLVKGAGTSTQQMIEDRVGKDRFSVVALASVTYMLLDVATNTVVRAGNPAGSASAHGTIGREFKLGEVTVT